MQCASLNSSTQQYRFDDAARACAACRAYYMASHHSNKEHCPYKNTSFQSYGPAPFYLQRKELAWPGRHTVTFLLFSVETLLLFVSALFSSMHSYKVDFMSLRESSLVLSPEVKIRIQSAFRTHIVEPEYCESDSICTFSSKQCL